MYRIAVRPSRPRVVSRLVLVLGALLAVIAAGCSTDTAEDTAAAPTTATTPVAGATAAETPASSASEADFNQTDIAFTQSMLPHHMQALRVAEVEVEKGMDPAMVELAQQIITAQEEEIATMQGFLETFGAPEMPPPADQQMVWDRNYQDILDASPAEVDVVFMTNMIPHHSAAVPMSQREITNGSYQPGIDLAEEIKMAQREEIMQMVMNLRMRN